MAKKNDKMWDLNGVDPIKLVSENVNKHGEIRGNDKKQTKALRSVCLHHYVKKNGKKIKAKLDVHGDTCQCKMCKEKMRLSFYSDNEIMKIYNDTKPALSQAKMMAASIGADLNTQREIAGLNLRFDNFPKLYGRMRKVAEKQESKNSKKRRKKDGDSAFGAWQVK